MSSSEHEYRRGHRRGDRCVLHGLRSLQETNETKDRSLLPRPSSGYLPQDVNYAPKGNLIRVNSTDVYRRRRLRPKSHRDVPRHLRPAHRPPQANR